MEAGIAWMARIRTVKPEFFLNEGLFDLEQETGCPMRIAFQGLWCQADREGRFPWQPRKLKTQITPYDEVDFSRVLDALASRGFLIKYASGGRVFGTIPSFKTHQFINNKEPQSAIPAHDATGVEIITCTREAHEDHALGTRAYKERNGKDRKGKDNPHSPPRGTDAYHADFLEWFATYPKRERKRAAYRAWQTAGKGIVAATKCDKPAAVLRLLDAAKAFAASDLGKGRYCPNPASWLTQGRYDDDRATWREASSVPTREGSHVLQLPLDDE